MKNKQTNYLDFEFQKTIFYLRQLKQSIQDNNQEISLEDKLLLVIKHAVIHDSFNEGSILITKNATYYEISDIQKHNYVWQFKNQTIDIEYLLSNLTNLGIDYSIKPYQITISNQPLENLYELSFSIILETSKIKRK